MCLITSNLTQRGKNSTHSDAKYMVNVMCVHIYPLKLFLVQGVAVVLILCNDVAFPNWALKQV